MPESPKVDFMRTDTNKYWYRKEKAFRSMILLRTFCSWQVCICVLVSVCGCTDDVFLGNFGYRETLSFLSQS